MSVRRALSQPLVQFALGGTLLFGAHRFVVDPRPDVVVVVPADASKAEVETRVDEALLVAYARARGLDRDDVIVRRRLAQKVRFAWEGAATPETLDDATLTEFRDAHPERYRVPARIGFTHAFVDASRHDDAEATARRWREALIADGAARVGDPFALGRTFGLASAQVHAGRFGAAFADALSTLPVGQWSVVQSSLGWHVVRVDATDGARMPDVAEIRSRLSADAVQVRRDARVQAQLRRLRTDFDVRIVTAQED